MDPSGRSRRGPGATRGFSPAPRDAVSPLQLSVYWRLALAHFFTSFLFFLDVYAAAAVSCRHGNGTEEGGNRSRPAEDSDGGKRNLVCDWTDWLAYAQTLYMVGLLLGSLVGGAVSDRYGKRTVLLVCVYVHALCGLVPALLPRAFLYLAVRCVTGVCCCCINICSFSLAVEWTPPAARLWASAFLPFCFSLGMMGGAPLAWLSATWTRLHLTLAVPQLVCLPLYLWIPESPRWLLLRRRTDVLDRYRDNSPADKQCLDLLLWSDLQKDTEDQKDPPPGGHAPSDIIYLRHPTVLLRLFVMSFVRYDTYLQLHIKTRSKGAWFNPPSPPQCGVSSHLLRHLHEHRLLRRRRLLRPVLLRPIGGTLPPRPIGPPGPPANQHARSVPEWSGLLPVLTAVPIRRSAGVGDESRSAGEALHPGRALHLHPVQHRAVPHRGQTAVCVLGQPVFPDWLPGQLRGPRHPHRGHLIGCHGRVQQRPNRGLRSVSASPGDQRRPAARLGRGLRQAADAPPPERGRPLEEVEAGEKPNQEY